MFNQKNFPQNNLYVVAVSGGPDSLFCLDNMRLAGYKIVVAHVNYQKRIDSTNDENLVRAYCQKYSLPLVVRLVEKAEYPHPSNFQAWARLIRYNFCRTVARQHHTRYLVVAHHRNDHHETYLLQKKRQNLVDYWGLPTITKQGKLSIFRPLLSYSKTQILDYLTTQKINFASDSTNQLPLYQRNILRAQIANWSEAERVILDREIAEKNRQLRQMKSLVNQQKKIFLLAPTVFQLTAPNLAPEVLLRLLYYWVNRATKGLLHQRKKKLLAEIYRQLFWSKKAHLVVNLGENWQITKNNEQAVIHSIYKN